MKRFFYRARDKAGQLVTGEVEASTIESAAKLIRGKDLIVISLKPAGGSLGLLLGTGDKVKKGQVVTMTRQLATMVNAGLPITQGLSILRNQSAGPLKKVMSQIMSDVEGGESFSKALIKHPTVFSPTFIALVKSGELGGVLDQVLLRLADNLEKEQEFNSKVKTALIYPIIIVSGMFIVGFIMMVFVIPKLTSLYTEFGAELPLPTKILIGISTTISRFWILILMFLGIAAYGLFTYRKTDEGRRQIDEYLLKIPIFGELTKQILLTELTRTLSLMVASGVSILEGLNITAGVVGNRVLSDALRDSAIQVEKGFPVSFAFARHPDAFPYLLSQMVAVGEETGKMDEVLNKVSRIFEIESDLKVKTLTSTIEPLVMVILGLGVAFLVIAIILPIYNLTTQF